MLFAKRKLAVFEKTCDYNFFFFYLAIAIFNINLCNLIYNYYINHYTLKLLYVQLCVAYH